MPSIENFLWLYCCAHNDFCKRGCPITEYELSGGPLLDRLLVLMNWTTFLAKRLDIPITYFQCNSSPPKNSYSVIGRHLLQTDRVCNNTGTTKESSQSSFTGA